MIAAGIRLSRDRDGGAGGRGEALSSGMWDAHFPCDASRKVQSHVICHRSRLQHGRSRLICHRSRLEDDRSRPQRDRSRLEDDRSRLARDRSRLICHRSRLQRDRSRLHHDYARQHHHTPHTNTPTTPAQTPPPLLPFPLCSSRLCGEYAFYPAHSVQAATMHRREHSKPR